MEPARPTAGSQTLARGLRALELIAAVREGMTIQEVADRLGVHRSIASRLLATLAEFRLVVRGPDGRFRTGAGLAALAASSYAALRASAEPVIRELAEQLGATVMLVVAEGEEAMPLSIAEPPTSGFLLSFRAGSRHTISRGSAGIALRAAAAAHPDEPALVSEARTRGYACSEGEVVAGAYGVAAPVALPSGYPLTCINVVSYRADITETAVAPLREAVARVQKALA